MKNKAYREWKYNLVRTARAKKQLLMVQYELTSRCNLECKMCYVHTQDNHLAKAGELSTEQWIKLFDDAYDQGMLFATLTGGECLIRRDFKELYLHLWKKRVIVSVLTNGILIDEEWVAFFRMFPPEFIQISLYGSSEESYLQVTGHKGFSKTIKAIDMLKEAGIDVEVVITPSRYLFEDYIPTLRLCKDKGYQTMLQEMVLSENRENPEKRDYYLTLDEMITLSIDRMKIYKELQPVENTPKPHGTEKNLPVGLKCNAGNCLATVTWNGKLHPCVGAIIGDDIDLKKIDFAKAWEKTQKVAASVLLPVECVGCPYEKVCVRCPMLRSPKRDGHCDPSICELTRRLVAAGVKKLDAPEAVDPEHGV